MGQARDLVSSSSRPHSHTAKTERVAAIVAVDRDIEARETEEEETTVAVVVVMAKRTISMTETEMTRIKHPEV